jgi:hypothetical protein
MAILFRLTHSRTARLHGAALLFCAAGVYLPVPDYLSLPDTRRGLRLLLPPLVLLVDRHALTTGGLDLYESNFVMFPFTSSYAYDALTLFWFRCGPRLNRSWARWRQSRRLSYWPAP